MQAVRQYLSLRLFLGNYFPENRWISIIRNRQNTIQVTSIPGWYVVIKKDIFSGLYKPGIKQLLPILKR